MNKCTKKSYKVENKTQEPLLSSKERSIDFSE